MLKLKTEQTSSVLYFPNQIEQLKTDQFGPVQFDFSVFWVLCTPLTLIVVSYCGISRICMAIEQTIKYTQ